DEGDFGVGRAERVLRGQAVQRLLLAHGADAARDALAARLVAEEGGDAQDGVLEIDRVVEQHHDARSERGADGARALERQRYFDLGGGDEYAGRAAEQDRLHRPAAAHAPREIDELLQRRAE